MSVFCVRSHVFSGAMSSEQKHFIYVKVTLKLYCFGTVIYLFSYLFKKWKKAKILLVLDICTGKKQWKETKVK